MIRSNRKSLVLGLFMVSILAAGCSRKLSTSTARLSTDSTYTEVSAKERDTTIHIKGSSTSLKVSTKDAKSKFMNRSGNASVQMQIANDTVFVSANCDSLEFQLHWLEKETATFRQIKDSLVNQQTFIKFKVPDSIKYLAAFGFAVLLLILVYIIYLLKK